LKIVHGISLASAIIGLCLLLAGLGKIGSLLMGLATVVELVVAATTGKQSNEGMH